MHTTRKPASISQPNLIERDASSIGVLAYSATGLPQGLSIDPTSGIITGTIALGAGNGQRVILSSDGKSTRALLGSETTPVRWSVMGIED